MFNHKTRLISACFVIFVLSKGCEKCMLEIENIRQSLLPYENLLKEMGNSL